MSDFVSGDEADVLLPEETSDDEFDPAVPEAVDDELALDDDGVLIEDEEKLEDPLAPGSGFGEVEEEAEKDSW